MAEGVELRGCVIAYDMLSYCFPSASFFATTNFAPVHPSFGFVRIMLNGCLQITVFEYTEATHCYFIVADFLDTVNPPHKRSRSLASLRESSASLRFC